MIRLTPQAEQDLLEIADYLHERNPQAAVRLGQRLKASLNLIDRHPTAGRLQSRGVRRHHTPGSSYLIFYRIDADGGAIEVLAVRHAARDPAEWPC